MDKRLQSSEGSLRTSPAARLQRRDEQLPVLRTAPTRPRKLRDSNIAEVRSTSSPKFHARGSKSSNAETVPP